MWNGEEMSYPGVPTAEEYRNKKKQETYDFMQQIVLSVVQETENIIKDKEDTALFMSNLVAEVANRADGVILQRHVEREAIPFTIHNIMPGLLGAVESHFIQRDNGEAEMEAGLQEDEEPEPSVIDSWAVGAVPVRRTKTSSVAMELEKSATMTEASHVRPNREWEEQFRSQYLTSYGERNIKMKEFFEKMVLMAPKIADFKQPGSAKKASWISRIFKKKSRAPTPTPEPQDKTFGRKTRRLMGCLNVFRSCFGNPK